MRVTQKQVLKEAVDFLARPGGFTSDHYFETPDGLMDLGPSDSAYAACAIGGVEQAVWKLTGETVARRERELLAQVEGASTPGSVRDNQAIKLYAGVMKRLNRVARRLYPFDPACEDDDGPCPIRTVEQVTFMDCSELARKRRTLKVFRTALAELDR